MQSFILDKLFEYLGSVCLGSYSALGLGRGGCVNVQYQGIVYASDVCNVVKYATVSAGQGVSSLKFAHRPTLLHRSNTNIEYFIKMATQAEFYLYYPQFGSDDIWSLFLNQNIVTQDSSRHRHWSLVTLVLTRPCGAIRDQEVFRRSQSFYGHMQRDKTLNHRFL